MAASRPRRRRVVEEGAAAERKTAVAGAVGDIMTDGGDLAMAIGLSVYLILFRERRGQVWVAMKRRRWTGANWAGA